MTNPFKQLVPDEEPDEQQLQQEVMGSVHLKSHLSDILEFFMAVLGVRREDIMPGQATRSDAEGESNDPGYFF